MYRIVLHNTVISSKMYSAENVENSVVFTPIMNGSMKRRKEQKSERNDNTFAVVDIIYDDVLSR